MTRALLRPLLLLLAAYGTAATPMPTTAQTPTVIPTISGNADWTPVEQAFGGVTMVLVPPGCFLMGTAAEVIAQLQSDFPEYTSADESPQHEQCFDAPFWIDRTEVTQAQFAAVGGTQEEVPDSAGDMRPVERITWFEARDFCKLRAARLPDEREWEYAVRGPDGLVYPWGNDWSGDRTVWGETSSGASADVASVAADRSWVGAVDMTGNVQEWVNTVYGIDDGDGGFDEEGEWIYAYPYAGDDGREADSDDRTMARVVRGGGWISGYSHPLRAAARYGEDPFLRYSTRGFRCARSG